MSCTFSTSSTSKKAQNPQFFTLLTSKCASRHNGVHIFDTFSTSQLPKVVRDRQFLTLLTSKCASRHNGVHFFNISTSKSAPRAGVFCTFSLRNVLRAATACTFSIIATGQKLAPHPPLERAYFVDPPEPQIIGKTQCFATFSVSRRSYLFAHVHLLSSDLVSSDSSQKSAFRLSILSEVSLVHFLDLEMCFAPQRRALFRHRNFQKWSEPLVFLTFWLPNVLRATTACNFSSLIWPAASAPAALASLLFDPPEPQIIGKTQCFATFLPFRASVSSFFWLFLFFILTQKHKV